MSVMTAWQDSWRECLALTSKNGRLLGTAIKKKIVETYRILFTHWWFLALLTAGTLAAGVFAQWQSRPGAYLASLLVCMVYCFMGFLSARPSVHKKNYSYFISYLWHSIGYFFACAALLVTVFIYAFARPWSLKGVRSELLSYWLYGEFFLLIFPFNFHAADFFTVPPFLLDITTVTGFYYSAFMLFFMFFWLDSQITIRSFFSAAANSLKMIVYNLPFVAFLSLLYVGIYNGLFLLTLIIPAYFVYALFVVLIVPAFMSIFSVFYTKKVHDQFDLYYPVTLAE